MKLRRIAAALVIVSLGAASFTFAAVRGQMADCRITEKTIVGDAAAAAGLSASFGMGLQNQLYDTTVQDIRCDIKRNLKLARSSRIGPPSFCVGASFVGVAPL